LELVRNHQFLAAHAHVIIDQTACRDYQWHQYYDE
jgi:hypothetical protein